MENFKQQPPKKTIRLWVFIVSLLAVAIAAGGIGYVAGSGANKVNSINNSKTAKSKDSSLTKEEKNLAKIIDVYNSLNKEYYTKVDQNKLVDGALDGMVKALDDPYSNYLTAKDAQELNNSISGSFEGIGAEVSKPKDEITIMSPIKGSPAEKAGLKAKDVIQKVDGKSISKDTLTQAVDKIRGKKGSKVTLTILRNGQSFNVEVIRDKIPVKTVEAELDRTDKSIGMIRITNFAEPTYKEVKTAVKDLRKKGAKSFVLDVRQNPGGLLDQALKISSIFLKDDQTIMQVQTKGKKAEVYRAGKSYDEGFKVTEPTVVLIDDGSASAAEIFAAALQESGHKKLIGTKSFGKGTVQNVKPYQDDSELKMTIAKWLTPTGKWIHKKGIKPDVEAVLPDYANLNVIDTTKTYQNGDVSKQVKNIEEMLKALDYDPGKIDESFDIATEVSVKKYQQDHKLSETGIVNKETAQAMENDLAKMIKENDIPYKKAIEILKEN